MYKRTFLIAALIAVSCQPVGADFKQWWPFNTNQPVPQPPKSTSWLSLPKGMDLNSLRQFAESNGITPARALAGLSGAGVLAWYRKPLTNAISKAATKTKEAYDAHSELYKNLAKLSLLGFAGAFVHKNGIDADVYSYVQQPGFIRGALAGTLATSLLINWKFGKTFGEFMELKKSYEQHAESNPE